jgi:glycosyltransferase involved in cell wall biosynthesis
LAKLSTAKKVLFLVPYPLQVAPSQRFRVELFLPELAAAGIPYSIEPFLDKRTWRILYKKGNVFLKMVGLLKGFARRWWVLFFKLPCYDYVFIHREAAPAGPPVFEWIITKLFRKKVIYDFDDAIWIPNTSSANSLANWFKAFWKVKRICKWSYKVTPGNDYLCDYASQFNQHVIKIPTCINVDGHQQKTKEPHDGKLSIGWTGSHSTLKYLDQIMPVVNALQRDFDFHFLVIADEKPVLNLKDWQFVPWNVLTETEDLLKLDIGVMPLTEDKWSEGKCGFKLIQYFSCGIPGVASPVGVNKSIIEENVNGFLCTTNDEWKSSLKKLLLDQSLREKMGLAGRKKIIEQYSIQSQKQKFIQLFS